MSHLHVMTTPSQPFQAQHADGSSRIELQRAGWFTALLVIINLVNDGWHGRPHDGLSHELALLPFTFLFLWALCRFLFPREPAGRPWWTAHRALLLALAFELLFVPIYLYEAHHYARVGYRARPILAVALLLPVMAGLAFAVLRRRSPAVVLAATAAAYAGGMLLSILSFPLTYLRSDMLDVILWADQALLRHVNPYITVHVADRLYDFPYLPGMMVFSYPLVAAHLDIRLGSMLYTLGFAWLAFWAARRDRRLEVAGLLALFLLCPYLEYRHELYLQPHWFTLMVAFVLMQRRRFAWAAFAFGISMAVYQFSWLMFPFYLLYGLRRRGWLEAIKMFVLGAAGALVVAGPFLAFAFRRIASNTVGQWGLAGHATAEPINFSFWITYVIRPDHLLRLQAALMVAIFAYCFLRNRCGDLTDTIRWMAIAVTLFVMCNVLVDGYFFLMVLVILLVYTCVANGWWATPEEDAEPELRAVRG